ncbi:hypothetical protein BsWGS_18629 [Bradybaena similaris]
MCHSSHSAIKAPERCVFAQFVNIGAFMMAANVYIRYKQMTEVLNLLSASKGDKRVNKVSLGIGFISAFGLTVVANFQTVDMRAAHYTGATLAFALGAVYCWMQTALSIRHTRWTCVAVSQLVNSIALTVCIIVFAVSKTVYKLYENTGHGTKFDALRAVYLISTVSEWMTAASIVTFVLTFYRDFSNVWLKSPSVRIINHDAVLKVFRSSVPGAIRQNDPVNL